MKKLLFFALVFCGLHQAGAQVILYVETPPALEGNLDFTWSDPGAGWGSPDLNDPLNAITGALVFASDGTAADSLCCNAVTNGAAIAGNIAVIYRGSCEFGAKALNAQNAGAIGVIIINNIPGSPIAMGAGAQGANVTIPVAMITDADGAALRSEILAGNVTVFLGSKSGYYNDDIGIYKKDVVNASLFSNPALLSQNASEFSVTPGMWVANYGNNMQSSISASCTIEFGGSAIYNQNVTVTAPVASGDSTFVTFPTFSQSSYTPGYYTMTYTANPVVTDEFMADNEIVTGFAISDSLIGYAPTDDVTLAPITGAAYRPTGTVGTFETCIHFRDPNASRLALDGLWVSNAAAGTDSLTGLYFQTVAYEWQDIFVDLDDPNFGLNSLIGLQYGDYTYDSNLENELVYVKFPAPVLLQDNVRYLFCLTVTEPTMYVGYNTDIDYDEVNLAERQPISPIFVDGTFYALGFGTDVIPTITARVFDVNELGVADDNKKTLQDIKAYPNPAVDIITIPMEGISNATVLEIFDLSGKLVASQNVQFSGNLLKVDVSSLNNGQYRFSIRTEEGVAASFSVVVNK
jgi:hypothetical protein